MNIALILSLTVTLSLSVTLILTLSSPGGGLGGLSRKFGTGSDQILAATVVTAAGDVVSANASQHSDLLWALKVLHRVHY